MTRRLLFCGAILNAALIGHPLSAVACGGFFCSQVPVLQTAERVVFEVDEDVVTAYVELQYEGDDPNFAWIIPVPEAPQVEVGIGRGMFDALEAQTQPIFVGGAAGTSPSTQVVADSSGGCAGGFSGGTTGQVVNERIAARVIQAPEVEVLQDERVGPYDVTTVDADNASDLNTWLQVNGYRVLPGSDQIVQQYLDEGMKLLALKLANEVGASAVEPIKLTYRDSRGCAAIPIRLTAIAAVPGLEIVTWVFGDARAVPENYGEVTIDPKELTLPEDYAPAMAKTIDEQGDGRAFVTEYAQPSGQLSARGDPILRDLLERHGYVTRLRTELDPGEMTLDPEFRTDHGRPDVSNVIELAPPAFGLSAGSLLAVFALGLLVVRRRRS